MHRLLALARVEIGTGRSDREEGGGVRLDGLTATQAGALREELLHRRRQAPAAAADTAPGAPAPAVAEEPEAELARLDSSWVRFAPFTLSGLVSVGVVLGFLLNVANEAHFDPQNWGPARHLADRLGHAPVALTALALLVLALVAVVVASTVGYALAFWDLTRCLTGSTVRPVSGAPGAASPEGQEPWPLSAPSSPRARAPPARGASAGEGDVATLRPRIRWPRCP
jgi:putative membrane protein